jgi:hypothetical protein
MRVSFHPLFLVHSSWCCRVHPFIGAGEGHAGARKGEMTGGNGLNTIEGGRLNEGLRGELKGGIKVGSEDLACCLVVGGRAAQGCQRR